ncbi:MAG: hypothetical protein M3015_05885 [Bacteroidota bacterium]|nr:hypothetical protein [Bacteroidota bacterium]
MEYTELSENICETLLIELFQSIPELLQTIAPDGFVNSPLTLIFHPTPEQQYKEYCRMSENIAGLRKAMKSQADSNSVVSFEEFIKDVKAKPVDAQYEIVSIFGDCIWEIFSNNHTVFTAKAESYDLGSWRGSGGFIADVINKLQLVPGKSFDYMDFYMGNIFTEGRTDLIPVYEFIFKKLKARNLDWEYSFPRTGLVSFNKDEDEKDNIENYDPSEAVKQQLQKEQQQNEIEKLQQSLDETYNAEYEEARYKKPSPEVMAYYNIYHHYPKEHPLAEG